MVGRQRVPPPSHDSPSGAEHKITDSQSAPVLNSHRVSKSTISTARVGCNSADVSRVYSFVSSHTLNGLALKLKLCTTRSRVDLRPPLSPHCLRKRSLSSASIEIDSLLIPLPRARFESARTSSAAPPSPSRRSFEIPRLTRPMSTRSSSSAAPSLSRRHQPPVGLLRDNIIDPDEALACSAAVQAAILRQVRPPTKSKLQTTVDNTIKQLDASQEGSKEEYEEKQKELEATAIPIMQKLHGAGSMPGGGMHRVAAHPMASLALGRTVPA
ncbi:hypothetical protein C8R45DRAFT_1183574 [Mycena sanguinolenta]|nr:hypothetical protein C8R45DRAFT_1184863 [Mycena sanguinolenta]KAJ6458550.1 hypothetical protein C8R45DRAFT_1183574 [Mycena sanguinolenta]